MSGLETAIRNALERSDRANAETRAKIYQSARHALEAGLRKQDVHDTDIINQQRQRLELTIRAIEAEERESLRTQALSSTPPQIQMDSPVARTGGAVPVAAVERPANGSLTASREPETGNGGMAPVAVDDGLSSFRPERRDEPRTAAATRVEADKTAAGKAVPVSPSARVAKAPRRRRGRLLSLFLVVTTLVVALGTAAWWVETSGLLLSDAERDTSVSNPPTTVQSEDFAPEGLKTLGAQAGFSGDWIEVFKPANIQSIDTRGDATVEAVSDEGGPAVRVSSQAPDQNGEITIPIPVEILEQMSGKASTLALTVQATTDKPIQFYVECDFSSLGKCGRHRFDVAGERTDVLLKVAFDRSLAPSAAGHLILNSDVSGAGQSLDLYAIRVLPGE